jgi:hypothetical protein
VSCHSLQSPLGWSRLTSSARADWQPPAPPPLLKPPPSWLVKVAAPPPPPPPPLAEWRWRRRRRRRRLERRRPGTRRRRRRWRRRRRRRLKVARASNATPPPERRSRPQSPPEVGEVSPLAHAPIGRSRCRFVATSTDVGPCCRWPGPRGRRSPLDASAAASGFQGGKLHVTPLGAHADLADAAFLLQHRLMLDLAAGRCCRATVIDCAAPEQALFRMWSFVQIRMSWF